MLVDDILVHYNDPKPGEFDKKLFLYREQAEWIGEVVQLVQAHQHVHVKSLFPYIQLHSLKVQQYSCKKLYINRFKKKSSFLSIDQLNVFTTLKVQYRTIPLVHLRTPAANKSIIMKTEKKLPEEINHIKHS